MKKNRKFSFRDFIKIEVLPFLWLTAGAVIAAAALEEFLVPFTILDGGVVGVSMILNQLTGIALGLFVVVVNIPFMLVGLKHFGLRFMIRGVYAMLLFSLLLEVFEKLPAITEHEVLVIVFGGMFLGIGVGLILKNGGCLDGTEIVALILSKKAPFSVGQIVLGFNIVIYSAAGFLFGLDRALYSLLTYFITSKVIDMVENGLDQGKAVMIITDDSAEIVEEIYRQLGRTCTIIEGAGAVSGRKELLYCVVTRLEISSVKRIIDEAEGSSFMTITDVSEIVGQHIKKNDSGTKLHTGSAQR